MVRIDLAPRIRKAARILATPDAIREVTDIRVFEVIGDNGVYRVTVTPALIDCTCPFVSDDANCSHVISVAMHVDRLNHLDPLYGLPKP